MARLCGHASVATDRSKCRASSGPAPIAQLQVNAYYDDELERLAPYGG